MPATHPTRLMMLAPVTLTAAIAQVPADAALLLESTPTLVEPYFKFVDVFGRGLTVLRGQSAFLPMSGVATDPSTTANFWLLGASSSFAGTWRMEVGALADIGTGTWGAWSQVAATRIAVGSERIATLSGGQVDVFLKQGNQAEPAVAATGAVDIAIVDNLLYVAGTSVVEVDLVSGNTRTVGSYPGVTSIAASPFGNELCIGTASGDLVRVQVATGNVTSTTPTTLGPIVDVEYTRLGTLVYGDGLSLWSELLPTAPLYTSPTTILDFAVGVADGATVTPFGSGCGVGASASWSTGTAPTTGNANFRLGVRDAPPTTPALLVLGGSRSLWAATGASLPFDLSPAGAPGCALLVDPQVALLQLTDGTGGADQGIPVPTTPSLVGTEFVGQWFLPDAAIGTLQFAATEGVAFVIG